MMKKIYIQHRVNQSSHLSGLSHELGVEIDLRSDLQSPKKIHLSHDPWAQGEDFDAWLTQFKAAKLQGPLILNTKEDSLETRALELLKKHQISNYFFLDTAAPTLVRWTIREQNRNFALRVSRYEPLASLEPFRKKAQWLWVDCFEGIPLDAADLLPFKSDFKICLVSPELQGAPIETISKFGELYKLSDAICTKSFQTWVQKFES